MENRKKKEPRLLAPVKGMRTVSYQSALDIAQENGFGSDITKITHLVPKNAIIMPTYMTEKAVGCDCFACFDVTIEPGEIKIVPTGVKASFDGDNEGLFPFVRSSIPKKKGLLLANGVGVIESDYYGNEDNDGNIGFMFYNIADEPVTVKRFERIGQLVIMPIYRFDNAYYADNTRGASGSTGI